MDGECHYRLNYNDCLGFLTYLALHEPEPNQTPEEFFDQVKTHGLELVEKRRDRELQQVG